LLSSDAQKHASPHVGYHAKFDSSWSNGMKILNGNPPDKWATRVPHFKVTKVIGADTDRWVISDFLLVTVTVGLSFFLDTARYWRFSYSVYRVPSNFVTPDELSEN